jgi:hypothetical protein
MGSEHSHAPHQTDRSDLVGQVLSAVCAVHCVSTPLVLLAAPALGSAFGGVHPVLFVGVVGVALWALIPGYRCHHHLEVPALASVGIALLGLAAFVFHDSFAIDTGLSLLGASFMMAAHWRNRVLLRAPHTHAHAHP